jgi:RNA polymerase sigma-70 factor (ECF subfamily)
MDEARPDEAFTVLYRGSYGPVFRFIARRVDDDEEAADLTAEVFRIAWSRMGGEPPPDIRWLFVTARNMLANHWRSVQRRDRAYRLSTAGSGDGNPAADLVAETLEAMAPDQRDVLVHYYWDRLSAREIATLTGISTGAVWVRLHRSRQAFKKTYASVSEAGRAYR